MILMVLLDGDGRPVCAEMWPGNTAQVQFGAVLAFRAVERLLSTLPSMHRACTRQPAGRASFSVTMGMSDRASATYPLLRKQRSAAQRGLQISTARFRRTIESGRRGKKG